MQFLPPEERQKFEVQIMSASSWLRVYDVLTGVPVPGTLFVRRILCMEVWVLPLEARSRSPTHPPCLNARMSSADLLFSNEENQLKRFVMQFLIRMI